MNQIQVLGVWGGGYVGLATGVGFAERGYSVVLVETDPVQFQKLTGDSFFSAEAELVKAFQEVRRRGKLTITNDPSLLKDIPFVFICVEIETSQEKRGDLTLIWRTVEELCPLLRDSGCVIIKSTVPVGTGDKIQSFIDQTVSGPTGKRVEVISYPPFMRGGRFIQDFRFPSRVILGGNGNSSAMSMLRSIISSWALPIMVTSRSEAELIKYASSAFLTTKISFINQIAQFCESMGADVQTVARGMGLDPHIGQAYFGAGIGFGGPALTDDIYSLLEQAKFQKIRLPLLDAVLKVNEQQQEWALLQIRKLAKEHLIRRLAIWGCSFQGGSEDIRESKAVSIMEKLLDEGYVLRIHDPFAMESLRTQWLNSRRLTLDKQQVSWHENRWEAAKKSDILVILTDWQEFREGPISELKHLLNHPVVVDGHDLFPLHYLERSGLTYISVGRKVRT